MSASTITMTPTPESSQLHGFGYEPESQTLAVEFNTNHGEITYHYRAVPPAVAAALAAAPSKGAFVFKNIKGKFDFDRLNKSG